MDKYIRNVSEYALRCSLRSMFEAGKNCGQFKTPFKEAEKFREEELEREIKELKKVK